jgi:hypothetical protein
MDYKKEESNSLPESGQLTIREGTLSGWPLCLSEHFLPLYLALSAFVISAKDPNGQQTATFTICGMIAVYLSAGAGWLLGVAIMACWE